MQQYTYALLLAGSLLIPLMRSFEGRICFCRFWFPLLAGILLLKALFIPWDVIFTKRGIWGFNPDYVSGLYLLGLPLEEWLFFVIIPYCVVFLYEVLRYFLPRIFFPGLAKGISIGMGIGLMVLGLMNAHRIYTLIVMLLTAGLLLVQPLLKTHRSWLSHFFIAYLITLLPFFVVNGLLTYLPVVWYNDAQNLGLRMGSIPIEDSAYFLSMMLLVMMAYEPLKKKAPGRSGNNLCIIFGRRNIIR